MADTVKLDASAAASAVKMLDQLKNTLLFMVQTGAASTQQTFAAASEFNKLNKTMNEMNRVVSTLGKTLSSFNATAAKSSSSGMSGLGGMLKGVSVPKLSLEGLLLGLKTDVKNVLESPLRDMFTVPLEGAKKLLKIPQVAGTISKMKDIGQALTWEFESKFILPFKFMFSKFKIPLNNKTIKPVENTRNDSQEPSNNMFTKLLGNAGGFFNGLKQDMILKPFEDMKLAFRLPVDDSFLTPFSAIKTQLLKIASELAAISLKGALSERTQKDLLIARTGSKEKGTAIFETVRNQAISAGIDPTEALKNTMTLLPMAENMDQYTKMTSMAMQLAAFDPQEGGTAKSGEAIKAAMNGDMTLLMRQYGISSEAAEGFDPQAYINNGDVNGFLTGLNQVFENANLGIAELDIVYKSPQSQINTLVSNLKTSLADAGMGALDVLSPFIARVQEAFNSGQLQGYFDILSAGLSFAAELFVMLGDAALWVITNIITYWPAIAAMLLTAAVFLIPTMIAGLYNMLLPLYMQIAGWLMLNLPILAVILVVGLLVAAVIAFGGTVGDIIGFVIGIIYALFATIKNSIAFLWNIIVSVAEFLNNVFEEPGYAIQNLFYNLIKNITDNFGSMINFLINGVNWLIGKINSISDLKIPLIPELDLSAVEGLKPDKIGNVVDFSDLRMKTTDTTDAYTQGNGAGKDLTDGLLSTIDNFSPDLDGGFALPTGPVTPVTSGTPDIANVNKVDEVGKVNDTVDIASEDLKTMRELAEMKNIQNFVSLQPTVSVQTGDINNGTDIDTIISRIERSLNEQIASSAEGVYA
ncbi:hypothetical protein [Paenibacillus sp. FSL H8-0537]|uniref:hypothetical protein n=1 Tax=Paenibacillus sp. FSL H8-0537 TaxID=2921399 RepID=UPI003100C961